MEMTTERIAELRVTNGVTVTCDDGTQRTFGHDPILAECLDEIERLQAKYEPGRDAPCEHLVPDGDYCEECNREYKRAASDQENHE